MLQIFERCYALRATGLAPAIWERIALPEAGGLRSQDPWLLAALDHVEGVKNTMELERRKRAASDTKVAENEGED